MRGILADINVAGPVEYLVGRMHSEPWTEFWHALGLELLNFDDVGLLPTATDLEIWQTCQSEQLVFITNNRNYDSADSLEAAIRRHNTPDSLPVFTIADLNQFRNDRQYVESVAERLLQYLLEIDEVRGAGRLFLP